MRPLVRGALVAALLTLWALACLRPIWRTFPDHLTPNRGDPLFNLYVLKWSARQVQMGLPDLWNANVFHPAPAALTLSDHLLGPAAVLALVEPALPDGYDAVAVYNLLFFASFVLSGATTCWVLRRSGCSLPASLLGGGIFAFAPFRLMHANHIQVLLAQWIPLTLWCWDRLLAERTLKRAALFLAVYLLHVTGGCYLAYMIHVPLLVIALCRLASPGGRELLSPAALRVLLPTAAVALGVTAALFLPYQVNARRLGLERAPEEIVKNGATLASYVAPSTGHVLGLAAFRAAGGVPRYGTWRVALHRSENTLTAGAVPTLLALYGAVLFRRRYRKPGKAPEARSPAPLGARRRLALASLAALAALAFVAGEVLTLHRGLTAGSLASLEAGVWLPLGTLFLLALVLWLVLRRRWVGDGSLRGSEIDPWERGLVLSGAVCFLLTFPVAYLPLARVIPGLDGMRVPARFYAFVSLTLAFLAARGLDGLVGRIRSRRGRALAWGAAALLVFASLLPRPLKWVPVRREQEFPAVYRWIAGRPEIEALVEVPVRPYGGDLNAMYFSTAHWKPIANGFSGYLPASYVEVRSRAAALPDPEGIALLDRLGITHLVVRTPDLAPRRQRGRGAERVVEAWERRHLGQEVELVHVSGSYRVYRIL